MLNDIKNYADAGKIAKRIIKLAKEPFHLKNQVIKSSVSIGIVSYPLSANSYEELMKNVDLALYESKKTKGTHSFYSDKLNAEFETQQMLEEKLSNAIDKQEFYCVYQPQVDIATNKVVGIEALLRWKSDKNISPATFIPVLENMGMSEKINHYVLDQVIQDTKSIDSLKKPIKVAINISLLAKNSEAHLLKLLNEIRESNLSDQLNVELEITENTVVETKSLTAYDDDRVVTSLKENHVTLAIDDFGIQHSSINRLIEYNFKTIKIDKSFIDKLLTKQSHIAKAIIKAVMGLSSELDLKVIAEGVETKEQVAILQQYGCHIVQGFYYYKPMPLDELKHVLAADDNQQ